MMIDLLLTEQGKVDYHINIFHYVRLRIIALFCRFRRASVVRMLRLTDAFIWEDLPLTDPDTGSLTMAAWISRIQKISYLITSFACIFHVLQSSVRMLTSDDRPMFYGTWYPFDTSKTPAYELTNITQVTKSFCWYRNIRLLCVLYYVKQNKLFIEREQYGKEYLCYQSVLLRHCRVIYFPEW
jgi:hypothetical protein